MAKFYYRQNNLVKVWRQNQFTIEAETKEEADAIAKQICEDNLDVANDDMDNVQFNESEFLFETEEPLDKMDIYCGTQLIGKNY